MDNNNGDPQSPSAGNKQQQMSYNINSHQQPMGPPCNYYPIPHGTAAYSPVIMTGFSPGMSPLFSPSFWNSPNAPNAGHWAHVQPPGYDQPGYGYSGLTHQSGMKLDRLLAGKRQHVQQRQSALLQFHTMEDKDSKGSRLGDLNKWSSQSKSLKDESNTSSDTNRLCKKNSSAGTNDVGIDHSEFGTHEDRQAQRPTRLSPDKEQQVHHAVPVESISPDLPQRQGYNSSPRQSESSKSQPSKPDEIVRNLNPSFSQSTLFQPPLTHYVAYVPVAVPAPGSPGVAMYPYPHDQSSHHPQNISEHYQPRQHTFPQGFDNQSNPSNPRWHSQDQGYSFSGDYNNASTRQSRSKSPIEDNRDSKQVSQDGMMRAATVAVQEILGNPGLTPLKSTAPSAPTVGDNDFLSSSNIESDQGERGDHMSGSSSEYKIQPKAESAVEYYSSGKPPKIQHRPNDDREIQMKNMQILHERKIRMLQEQHHMQMMQLQANQQQDQFNRQREGSSNSVQGQPLGQKFWPQTTSTQGGFPPESQRTILHGGGYGADIYIPKAQNMIGGGINPTGHWPEAQISGDLPGHGILPNFARDQGRVLKRTAGDLHGNLMIKNDSKLHSLHVASAPKKARQKLDELQISLHQLQQVNHRLRSANESLQCILHGPPQNRAGPPQRSLAALATRNSCLRHAILELQSIAMAGKSASEEQLAAALSRCDALLSLQDDPPVTKEIRGTPDFGDIKVEAMTLNTADVRNGGGSWSMRAASGGFQHGHQLMHANHDSANTLLALASSPRTRALHVAAELSSFEARANGFQIRNNGHSNIAPSAVRSYQDSHGAMGGSYSNLTRGGSNYS